MDSILGTKPNREPEQGGSPPAEADPHGPPGSYDNPGFALLLATAERSVFVYVMSLLHHAVDAEEALQRTRVVLWQKFHQYQPGTDFIRWACGVARWEALKIREQRSREKRLFTDVFVETLADEADKSLDFWKARRQALGECMGKLRPEDRNLLLRRYEAGATTGSVAKALKRSPQGTRRSLHRLREALADCVTRALRREGDL